MADSFTLEDLHNAEAALARRRAGLESGEIEPSVFDNRVGCAKACTPCDFRCSLTIKLVQSIRESLALSCAPVSATVH
jgi:hypothetical protein